jgi:urease accessory protein
MSTATTPTSFSLDNIASPPTPLSHLNTTTVSTPTAPSWLLWQFLDSALPTGGFIASNGLEAFAKLHPDATSPKDVEAYVNWSVHSCGYTNLPFVTAIWKLVDEWTLRDCQLKTEKGKAKAMKSVLHRIGNIDREYDVFMNNAIQNAASRKQGDGIVMMGVKCFADQLNFKASSRARSTLLEEEEEEVGEEESELGPNIRILKPFKALLRSEEVAGHYPIAFAMIARLLGFDLGELSQDALLLFILGVFYVLYLFIISFLGPLNSYNKIPTLTSSCADAVVVGDSIGVGGTVSGTAYHDSIAGQGKVYRCKDGGFDD